MTAPDLKPRLRTVALLTACGVLIVPATASAAPGLRVGQADGVRVERQGNHLVVTFTGKAKRLFRFVSGRLISLDCTRLPPRPDSLVLFDSDDSGGGQVRVPERRRPIRTRERARGADFCRLWAHRRRSPSRLYVTSVPLTMDGAVYLDEERRAFYLAGVLELGRSLAAKGGREGFAVPADLIADLRREEGFPIKVVALSSAADTPPANTVGYFSDGGTRAGTVTLSAGGRRLLLEVEEEGVIRTNVARYLYGDFD